VAPAGFERPYPAENAVLYHRILAGGGAYLAVHEPTRPAKLGAFFERNALLVALAHAVVLVEAPFRSGARNAAQHARQLGRPLWVVPSAPWNARGRGCIHELQLGARALLSYQDVLRSLGEQRLYPIAVGKSGPLSVAGPPEPTPGERPLERAPKKQRSRRRDIRGVSTSEDESALQLVMEAVRAGAQHTDVVASELGLSVAVVQHVVLLLTLQGRVTMDTAGRLMATDRST
jgi:DNA processing protein